MKLDKILLIGLDINLYLKTRSLLEQCEREKDTSESAQDVLNVFRRVELILEALDDTAL